MSKGATHSLGSGGSLRRATILRMARPSVARWSCRMLQLVQWYGVLQQTNERREQPVKRNQTIASNQGCAKYNASGIKPGSKQHAQMETNGCLTFRRTKPLDYSLLPDPFRQEGHLLCSQTWLAHFNVSPFLDAIVTLCGVCVLLTHSHIYIYIYIYILSYMCVHFFGCVV